VDSGAVARGNRGRKIGDKVNTLNEKRISCNQNILLNVAISHYDSCPPGGGGAKNASYVIVQNRAPIFSIPFTRALQAVNIQDTI
jgi:hypothetical protein